MQGRRLRAMSRRFATPVLMEREVELYFFDCEARNIAPTLSGLALSLGFSTLGALRRYEGYDEGEYKGVIDRARLHIMDLLEQSIAGGRGGAGAQFLLKNLDKEEWRDRTETAVDVKDTRQDMTAIERMNRVEAMIQQARQEKIANSIPHEPEDDSWMQ